LFEPVFERTSSRTEIDYSCFCSNSPNQHDAMPMPDADGRCRWPMSMADADADAR